MIGKRFEPGALTKNYFTGMGDAQSIHKLVWLVFGNETGVKVCHKPISWLVKIKFSV